MTVTSTTSWGLRHPDHPQVLEFDQDEDTARRMLPLDPQAVLVARTTTDTGWQQVEP